jgi:hypothetical protein
MDSSMYYCSVTYMGLSDVAGLVTNDPKTKERIVFLLNLLGKRQLSLKRILENVEYNERYLRFLITKLRGIRLLMGERRGKEYHYYLSYESFTTYLKTKYSDAIYNLVKRG